MSQSLICTVLFADLRGSTSLYESLGNAEAASLVTQSVSLLARLMAAQHGRVVKTLGDGLMAVFTHPTFAVQAADDVQESFSRVLATALGRRAQSLKVQIALVHGEMIEVGGDCFGDAVNVAARLLSHAGDGETLLTVETLQALIPEQRAPFRRLDKLHLRGRIEPVEVWRMEARRGHQDTLSTMFGDTTPSVVPDGIRLTLYGVPRVHTLRNLPVMLGRSQEAGYCLDDNRVSRMHARVEWHGGNFQLTDLSSNGTFVRFGRQTEVVSLRRSACTLHGQGVISLGVSPQVHDAPIVMFEVLRFDETVATTLP